jgi:hypothetical protein
MLDQIVKHLAPSAGQTEQEASRIAAPMTTVLPSPKIIMNQMTIHFFWI